MTLNQNITALIFDDHRIFADTFSLAIERLNIFRSVLSFSTEEELVDYFKQSSPRPTYLFLDYYLPEKSGLSLIKEIRRLSKQVKIIMLTSLSNPLLINDILQNKPDAFLSKSSGLNEVLEAIRSVERSIRYISPAIQAILDSVDTFVSGFTERELELLQYFGNGYSVERTSKALHLSMHTVVAHRRNMMQKARCKSIVELLAYSRNAGLL